MDRINIGDAVINFIKKYRYMIAVFLIGLMLMILPDNSKEIKSEVAVTVPQNKSLQESLAEILSQIDGAGDTKVLLTVKAGEKMIYQTDTDSTDSDTTSTLRSETVLITDSSREGCGLIQQVISPVYQGAVVLCQGADHAAVRLAIVDAIANTTGLPSNQITVLKMK